MRLAAPEGTRPAGRERGFFRSNAGGMIGNGRCMSARTVDARVPQRKDRGLRARDEEEAMAKTGTSDASAAGRDGGSVRKG